MEKRLKSVEINRCRFVCDGLLPITWDCGPMVAEDGEPSDSYCVYGTFNDGSCWLLSNVQDPAGVRKFLGKLERSVKISDRTESFGIPEERAMPE